MVRRLATGKSLSEAQQDLASIGAALARAFHPGPVMEWLAVPEKAADDPDPKMCGNHPSYGLYVRRAAEIDLRGLTLEAPSNEPRPGIVADDVAGLRFDSVRTSLWLNDVQGGSVVESGPAVRITGPRSTVSPTVRR
jgi:hypothetical protein